MPVVTGVVRDPAGRGVPGVWVYPSDGPMRSRGTHTRRDGTWTLDLCAGWWDIREVGHYAHRVLVGTDPVTVDDASTRAPGQYLDLGPEGGATSSSDLEPDVAGVVFDPDPGAPVPEPLPEQSETSAESAATVASSARVPRDGGRGTSPARARRIAARQPTPAEPIKSRPPRVPRDGGRVRPSTTTEES